MATTLIHKSDIVDQIAQELNYPKVKVSEIVDTVFTTIENNLKGGKEVSIKGFGKWSLLERAAKKGHVAPNGKVVDIPAFKQVRFKAGRTLKAEVKNA